MSPQERTEEEQGKAELPAFEMETASSETGFLRQTKLSEFPMFLSIEKNKAGRKCEASLSGGG